MANRFDPVFKKETASAYREGESLEKPEGASDDSPKDSVPLADRDLEDQTDNNNEESE